MKFHTLQKILFLIVIIPALLWGAVYDEHRIYVDDGGEGDLFGYAISSAGTTMIVGAPGYDITFTDEGVVYVFDWDADNWSLRQKLQLGKPHNEDNFGTAVAMGADFLVISAPTDIVGVPSTTNTGDVFIFDLNTSNYEEGISLVPATDDRNVGDLYGISVATNGDYIAIGASRHDPSGVTDAGAVYIFKKGVEKNWTFVQKITASNQEEGAQFGRSVAMSNSALVVGAYRKDFADPEKVDAGAVYFFGLDGDEWVQEHTYPEATTSLPANFNDFGRSVSVYETESSDITAIVGNPAANQTTAGSVYMFNFDGTNWTLDDGSPITPAGLDDNTWWGQSVFLYGDSFLGGDYAYGDHGASIQFKNDGSTWASEKVFTPQVAQTDGGDQFGFAVSMTDEQFMVGAPGGKGGDGGSVNNTGVVYAYVPQVLKADFSGAPVEGNVTMEVAFTDLSTGDVTGWDWNFGDGNTSTEQNPVHQYTEAGVYNVTLTVTDGVDTDEEVKSEYINVGEQLEYGYWTQVRVGTSNIDNLYDVQVTDQNTAFAVGGQTAGMVLKTDNQGLTWSKTAATSRLNAVHFIDNENGYAAGLNGLLLSTNNLGENWSAQTLPYTYAFTDVWFNSTTTGFLAGENTQGSDTGGWIVMTTNGGEDWTQVGLEADVSTGSPLRALYFVDADTGYAAGGKTGAGTGVIYKTINGGETWKKSYTTEACMLDIWFTSAATGYAVGSNSVIYKTTDYGSNWTYTNLSQTDKNLHAADFLDEDQGFIVTQDHELLSTENAGTDWAWDDFAQLYQDFNGIDMHSSGTGFIVGSYGLILRYDAPPPLAAAFSASPTTGTVPLEVNFTDQSTGTPTSWDWDFGDGTSSDNQNPVHEYMYPGTYTVVLTVGAGENTSTSTLTNLITARSELPENYSWSCISRETMFGEENQHTVNQMAYNPFDSTIVVATSGGVAEYSGIFWRHYAASDNDNWPQVNAVAIDSTGKKWFGLSGGVRVFGANDTTSHDPTESAVHDIFVAPDSSVWLATDNGLAYYDGEDWTIYNTTNSDLTENQVNRVTWVPLDITDGDTIVLASTNGGGLCVFDKAENSWSVIDTEDGLPDDIVYNVIFDDTRNAWLTMYHGGIVKMDVDTEAKTTYLPFDDGDNGFYFSAVGRDNNGNIWAAGQHSGLARFDGVSWQVFDTESTDLCSDMVRSSNILVEPNGTIWFGTWDAGVIRLGPDQSEGVDFYADVTAGYAPLTVQFYGFASGGAPTYWSWDFDNDGTLDVFDEQSPSYTFNEPGLYTVRLFAPFGDNNQEKIRYEYINVLDSDETKGDLRGKITDATNGNGIPGATVTIGTMTTTTDVDGNYEFLDVSVTDLAADFIGNPRNGQDTLNVQFTDLSSFGRLLFTVSADGFTSYSANINVASSTTTYNVSLSPTLVQGGMRIVLNWGSSPTDMDIHLKTPEIEGSTYEVNYSNKGNSNSAPYAQLDIDDTSSYGPETITIYQKYSGTYKCFVYNYSGSPAATESNSEVRVYNDQGLLETINIPTYGEGRYWYVCDIDGSTGNVTVVNTLGVAAPSGVQYNPQMAQAKPELPARAQSSGPSWAGLNEITSWEWDFQNNGTVDATTKDPSFGFGPGVYDVKLTVSDGENSDSIVKEGYVTVTRSGSAVSGYVTDAVTGRAIEGATVTIGDHTTTTDEDGYYHFDSIPIGAITANFSGAPTSGSVPLTVQFQDLSAVDAQRVVISADGYYTYDEFVDLNVSGTSVNVSLSPEIAEGLMRVVLTWGETPYDLDLHMMVPEHDGQSWEISYNYTGDSLSAPLAKLDIDDTSSFGPETITLYDQFTGTYKVFVFNYSGSPDITGSNGVVQVYNSTGLLQTINIPTTGDGRFWYVCDIDGETGSVTVVNTIGTTKPEGSSFNPQTAAPKPELPQLAQGSGRASTHAVTNWYWDFDNDGTVDSNEKNPSFTYNAPGTYAVKLMVSDGINSDVEIKQEYITVNGNLGTVSGYVTDALTGDPVSGVNVTIDGLSATTDANGFYEITNIPFGGLNADFIASPLTGGAPLSVQFQDNSQSGSQTAAFSAEGYYNSSSTVNYSDGGTTLNVSLSPVIEEGQMRVVLTWGESPSDLDLHLVTPPINDLEYEISYNKKGNSEAAPWALLDIDDTSSFGPETITLYDRFTGTYKVFVYNYTGSPDMTTSEGRVQVFSETGLMESIAIPTTGDGRYWYVCDIDGSTGAVTVINTINTSRPAGSSYNPRALAPKKDVQPQLANSAGGASSTHAITSWQWDFNNDGTVDATEQNPSFVYNAPGSYTVKLTVSDGTNSDEEIKYEYINVSGVTAAISGYVADAVTGDPIANALVTIAGLTTYTNDSGYYIIQGVPVGDLAANFTGSPREGDSPLVVQFTDQSSSNAQLLSVNAGDDYYVYEAMTSISQTGTQRDITMSPKIGEGQMRVVLSWGSSPSDLDLHLLTPAINGNTYEIDYSRKGSRDSAPWVELDIDDTNGNGPETITLYDRVAGSYKVFIHNYSGTPSITTSNGTVQVFGDTGLLETINVPTTGDGRYWNVCKIDGNTGQVTVINTIESSVPQGSLFSGNSLSKKSPTKMVVDNAVSEGVITSWAWDFNNDGSIDSNEENPIFTYATPGNYSVALTVSDGTNTHTKLRENYIAVTENTTYAGYNVLMHGIDAQNFPDVKVYATVLDEATDTPVTNLSRANFDVEENGSAQALTSPTQVSVNQTTNLDLVIVLDKSADMANVLEFLQNNFRAFSQELTQSGINHRFGLVTYGQDVERVSSLTSDMSQFNAMLTAVKCTGTAAKTNALNALVRASQMGFDNYSSKAVVLFTKHNYYVNADGYNKSSYTATSVGQRLKNANIVGHIVGPDIANLALVPSISGGLIADINVDLNDVFQIYATVLKRQYVIKYRTADASAASTAEIRNVVLKAHNNDNTKSGYGTGYYKVGSSRIVFEPLQIYGLPNSNVTFNINAESLVNMDSCSFSLEYDTGALEYLGYQPGTFLTQDGSSVLENVSVNNGLITIFLDRQTAENVPGVNGSGNLLGLQFRVLSNESSASPISFNSRQVWDQGGSSMSVETQSPVIESPYVTGTTQSAVQGDFDNNLIINTKDLVLLSTYWGQSNPTAGDIGPANGTEPFLTPVGDDTVNYEDLTVFSLMWNWYHNNYHEQTGSLGKTSQKVSWLISDNIENERSVDVEVYAQDITNLGMGHIQVQYDPNILRFSKASAGELFTADKVATAFFTTVIKPGLVDVAVSRLANREQPASSEGTGALITLQFERVELAKESEIVLKEVDLRTPSNKQFVMMSNVAAEVSGMSLPDNFTLSNNYPNPFNGRTHLEYSLPKDAHVEIVVYNILGQPVRKLIDADKLAGEHQISWDGLNDIGNMVSSGIYFVRMKSDNFKKVREMLFLK